MISRLLAITLVSVSVPVFAAGADFTLKVDDLDADGGFKTAQLLSAPYGFGCSGDNRSPAISWKNAPAGTRSFVLTIHDQDAPTGLGWMHWVVANIPANVSRLPAGITADGKNLPVKALQTRTDFGVLGYGGPCPPKGQKHRYKITLTALGVEALPNVTADATPALVGFFARANTLGEASVTINDQR